MFYDYEWHLVIDQVFDDFIWGFTSQTIMIIIINNSRYFDVVVLMVLQMINHETLLMQEIEMQFIILNRQTLTLNLISN